MYSDWLGIGIAIGIGFCITSIPNLDFDPDPERC
jgi:hypothetical protein